VNPEGGLLETDLSLMWFHSFTCGGGVQPRGPHFVHCRSVTIKSPTSNVFGVSLTTNLASRLSSWIVSFATLACISRRLSRSMMSLSLIHFYSFVVGGGDEFIHSIPVPLQYGHSPWSRSVGQVLIQVILC